LRVCRHPAVGAVRHDTRSRDRPWLRPRGTAAWRGSSMSAAPIAP
jgi:hypothetical protein